MKLVLLPKKMNKMGFFKEDIKYYFKILISIYKLILCRFFSANFVEGILINLALWEAILVEYILHKLILKQSNNRKKYRGKFNYSRNKWIILIIILNSQKI